MTSRPTPLERAFELARSGDYPTVSDVKKQMIAEGLSISQIDGPTLMRQLRALCVAAKRTSDA